MHVPRFSQASESAITFGDGTSCGGTNGPWIKKLPEMGFWVISGKSKWILESGG